MTNVLAFDFGASSGRAILGSFDGERIAYREVRRFENVPVREENRLAWDYDALLKEVKDTLGEYLDVDAVAFDTWGVDYGLISGQNSLMGLPTNYRDSDHVHQYTVSAADGNREIFGIGTDIVYAGSVCLVSLR